MVPFGIVPFLSGFCSSCPDIGSDFCCLLAFVVGQLQVRFGAFLGRSNIVSDPSRIVSDGFEVVPFLFLLISDRSRDVWDVFRPVFGVASDCVGAIAACLFSVLGPFRSISGSRQFVSVPVWIITGSFLGRLGLIQGRSNVVAVHFGAATCSFRRCFGK